MWLKEREFQIKLGGQLFINVGNLVAFRGESIFTVRRREEDGDVGIDCDVYAQDGSKIASIRRNNPHPSDKVKHIVERTDSSLTLKDARTGSTLVQVKRNESAFPLELEVTVRTYLPDGRLLDAGPEYFNVKGTIVMKGCTISNCQTGIEIN